MEYAEIPLWRDKRTLSMVRAIVSPYQAPLLSPFKWYIRDGYAVASVYGRPILMHRFITGAPDGAEVHHVNQVRHQNQDENLVLVPPWLHPMLRTASGKVGFVGVTQLGQNYQARLKIMGSDRTIGTFRKAEDAALARDAYHRLVLGSFALNLNCPDAVVTVDEVEERRLRTGTGKAPPAYRRFAREIAWEQDRVARFVSWLDGVRRRAA